MRRGALLDYLASDAAPLAAAQGALFAARDAWRADSRCAALLADLVDYGAGTALGRCPALEGALSDPALADGPVEAFLDHMLPVLAAHPLGQMPFRHGNDGGVGTLLLAREGRALLSLVAREPGRHERCAVSFGDGERGEIVLAGKARGRLVRRDATLAFEPCALERGTHVALDLTRNALLVDEIEARLVTLRLVRIAEEPGPTREYDLANGQLLHQSAGDPGESRQELMLALLGRMGRTDAAPVMAEMTRGGSDHLRWQALRECIALDTAAGFAALCDIADDPADSLRAPAMALRDQLCAAHPALAELEPA